jgi:hypothetical protein
MSRVLTGVKIEKDDEGKPQTVTIDLIKNPALHDVLVNAGIIKAAKIIKKTKVMEKPDSFIKDCLTREQAIVASVKLARKWPKKK